MSTEKRERLNQIRLCLARAIIDLQAASEVATNTELEDFVESFHEIENHVIILEESVKSIIQQIE